MNKGGRPQGRQNSRPTKQAINGYYAMLKSAADEGDTNAAGWLVATDKLDAFCVEQERERNQRRLRDADGDPVAHLEATRQHLMFEIDQAEFE